MNTDFNSKEYKRYRKAYVTQCTLEHLLGLLVLDAFLAKLLTYVGIGDSLVGVITSFTSVAFVFQLLSVLLVQSKISTKKIVVTADAVSMLLFMLIYFVPFVPLTGIAKKIFVMLAVMVAQASKCVIATLYFKWANAYVSPENRAVFSARKEMISLICGIVFSVVAGFVVDKFESIGNLEGGFLFIAITMLIINVANFMSFMLIKDEDITARENMRVPTKQVLKDIFADKIFRNYFLLALPDSVAGGIVASFIGIYKIKDLGMSLFLIQIINIAADFVRIMVSVPFAKYSAKKGYLTGIQFSIILNGIAYILVALTTPETWWLIIPYTFLASSALAANYQNSYNVYYTLVPTKYMTQAMAFRQTFSGLVIFFSALLGGRILDIIQANGNMVFGVHMYAQQFLALISLPMWVLRFYLLRRFVIKPLEKRQKINV